MEFMCELEPEGSMTTSQVQQSHQLQHPPALLRPFPGDKPEVGDVKERKSNIRNIEKLILISFCMYSCLCEYTRILHVHETEARI